MKLGLWSKCSACVLASALVLGVSSVASSATIERTAVEDSSVLRTAGAGMTDTPPSTEAERGAALKALGIAPTPDWLALNDHQFVSKLSEHLDVERWPSTRKAALEALKGANEDRAIFIRFTVHQTGANDLREWEQAEALRKRELRAKKYVLEMMKVQETPELVNLGLRDFVIKVRDLAKGRYLREAASVAALNEDRAVWLAFLETGAREAIAKDNATEDGARHHQTENRRK